MRMSKTDQRTTATKHNTIIALRYNIPELRIVLAQFETEPWKESLRDAHSILVVPVLKSGGFPRGLLHLPKLSSPLYL